MLIKFMLLNVKYIREKFCYFIKYILKILIKV